AADGDGNPVTLDLIASAGKSLSHGEFLLAIATENYDGGTGAIQVSVDASPVLVPSTLANPVVSNALMTAAPVALNQALASVSDSLAASDEVVYQLKTLTEDNVTIDVSSSQPVIAAIYDSTGTTLIDVEMNPSNHTVELASNEMYLLRLSSVQSANFALNVQTSYNPEPVNFAGSLASRSFSVSNSLPARHFRLTPDVQDDVVSIRVEQDIEQPLTVVIVTDNGVETQSLGVGSKLFTVDVSTTNGPVDVFVNGKATTSNVQLDFGVVDIVESFVGSPPTITPSLDGQNSFSSGSNLQFGESSSVRWLEPIRQDTGQGMVYSVNAPNNNMAMEMAPAAAIYRKGNSRWELVRFALPDLQGKATLELTNGLQYDSEYMFRAINLNPIAAGIVQHQINAAPVAFVGVQMVPDVTDTTGYSSIFAVRDIHLQSNMDRDLWKTILPNNLLNLSNSTPPRVTLNATNGNHEFRIKAWVNPDDDLGSTPLLNQVVSGGSGTFLLDLPIEQLKGAEVFFQVTTTSHNCADYTLEMVADTTDTEAYFVDAVAYRFSGTNPTGVPQATETLPDVPVIDIIQNQFGDGSHQASFTNPAADTTGSVAVYRFWAITPGPLSVRSIGLSPGMNTNLRIYKSAKGNNNVEYLDLVDSGDLLGDWYPADRSVIDDQSYINNFNAISYGEIEANYETGGGLYYVVVKNEQGTIGDYRIDIDATPFPLLGDATNLDAARKSEVIHLQPNQQSSTSATIDLPYIDNIREFLGFIPIQLPPFHDGTLVVEGQPNSSWHMNLFDPFGNELPGNVIQTGGPTYSEGTFTIPLDVNSVYLRVNEYLENPGNSAGLTIQTNIDRPNRVPIPPGRFPASGAERILSVLPSGNSTHTHSDSMSTNGEFKKFGFQLPAGRATLSVVPEQSQGNNDVELNWAVYVDGDLWSWNDTRSNANGVQLDLLLPNLRPPLENSDFDYDRSNAHEVVIVASAQSAPQNGGDFSINITTESSLPMHDGSRLALPPRGWVAQEQTVMNGREFMRVEIPSGFRSMVL
ncbi:MAG: hypothetical protein AAF497_11900, partial [Planctomycetota bacterium]